jgi:hypothetical protein
MSVEDKLDKMVHLIGYLHVLNNFTQPYCLKEKTAI